MPVSHSARTRATGSSFGPRRQYASFSIFLSRAHTFPFSAPPHHLAKGVAEAAGVVSIARIERPPFHRGGSASTETISAVSPLPLQARLVSFQGWGLIDLPL